jgi:hypothetical protein
MTLLKYIEGFDDVGIGVIWQDKGKGKYILCRDLEGYNLDGVQIYRYNQFFMTMRAVDSLEEDSDNYVYCVKREDLI